MSREIPLDLKEFAAKNDLTGLTAPSLKAVRAGNEGYTIERGKKFLTFQDRINRELLTHRVISNNTYTKWVQQGGMNRHQVKDLVVQFSVFSNLFLIAQLLKTIHADSLEGMRASKEILANEIGVVFKSDKQRAASDDTDPEIVSTEGTVDGGTFRFKAGHFEWLLQMGEKLGLTFNDMGKRSLGRKPTIFFCDELARLYGSENYQTSQAASYAVENWANAGFWQELVDGLTAFKETEQPDLPLGFWTFHNRLEAQHAAHTQEELEEYYFEHHGLNEDNFIKYGNEMLDGVAAFWDGLDDERKKLAA